MKILFAPKEFPHSRVIGGPILVYNRIKHLARDNYVGLATFIRDEDRQYLDSLHPYVSELEVMPYPPRRSLYQQSRDFLFPDVPPYMADLTSDRMRQTIAAMTRRTDYDVVVAEYVMMGQYLYQNHELNPRTKRVLSCHECYTCAKKKIMAVEGRWSRDGLRALRDTRGLQRYEFAMYADVDRVLTLTPQERDDLLSYDPDLEISVVPHGADVDFFTPVPVEERELAVAFLGNFPHDPNRDAVMRFINEMWPQVKAAVPGVKLYVIGRGPTPDILAAAAADSAIVVTGEVDDVRPHLGKAMVFVSPIHLGSGFRGKHLEAMAMGIPVVTTSLGGEGIAAGENQGIVIANATDDFVRATVDLLTDDARYEAMSRSARQLIEDKYTYEKGAAELERVLLEVTGLDRG